jgi:hypothetical protein
MCVFYISLYLIHINKNDLAFLIHYLFQVNCNMIYTISIFFKFKPPARSEIKNAWIYTPAPICLQVVMIINEGRKLSIFKVLIETGG